MCTHFLVEELYKYINDSKCQNKPTKGDRGEQGEEGEQGLPGEKGEKGIEGPQGLPGVDGNSAVIMEIVHSKQERSTMPLTRDQQRKVTELAKKTCEKIYW